MNNPKTFLVQVRGLNFHPDNSLENIESGNIILYIGLGMVAIGLVTTFVGLGERGFKTLELKLVGPSLVGCGLVLAVFRVLLCTVPAWTGGTGDMSEVIIEQEESEKLLEFEQLGDGNSNFAVKVNGEVKKLTFIKHQGVKENNLK